MTRASEAAGPVALADVEGAVMSKVWGASASPAGEADSGLVGDAGPATGQGYRADIDGMRALAILSVLAFHAAPTLVPGGFVGVDIFFVISGFLITRIIAGQRDVDRFAFRDFYRRRARRILPAYFTVTAVVALAADFILLPRDLSMFDGSLAASSLFLANVWFAHGFGYFQPASRLAPLLHLWSLAIEEQFYLVWPLLIAGLSWRRIRPLRATLMAVLAAASLGLAAWMVSGQHAGDAFYYLPGRAWEFLAGGLLAVGRVRPPASPMAANLAGFAGMALIAASLGLLSAETPFPGLTAIAPCLGAVLMIWSGDGVKPVATAWLRATPVVGLGRVSYSLYLWHWPILALARLAWGQPLPPTMNVVLLAPALGLSALTWRFVEQPWRARRPRWADLVLALAAAGVLCGVGVAGFLAKGWPARTPPGLVLEETDINPLRDRCLLAPWAPAVIPAGCASGPSGPGGQVLVWGDSHADALAPGVAAWAKAQGMGLRQATRSGCPPLVATRVFIAERAEDARCPAFNAAVLRAIATDPRIRIVVMSARWPLYENALPRMADFDPAVRLVDADAPRAPSYQLDAALGRTLDAIAASGANVRVVVVGPVPELPFSVPGCIAQSARFGLDRERCARAPARDTLARAAPALRRLGGVVASHPGVRLIAPTAGLCSSTTCATMLGGESLYYDADHLSASGARRLAPGWLDAVLPPDDLGARLRAAAPGHRTQTDAGSGG